MVIPCTRKIKLQSIFYKPRFRVDSSSSDVTRWTQHRSERDTTWSHWRRRREVENMALLASAARRAARTTAIQKAFRCICSQRTKKYDENGYKFVQQRRAEFVGEAVDSAHNSLCSGHFEESCFTRKTAVQLE